MFYLICSEVILGGVFCFLTWCIFIPNTLGNTLVKQKPQVLWQTMAQNT